MSNRAERRRQIRSGDGRHMVESTGMLQKAAPQGRLQPKIPGKHRWIAAAMYTMSDTAMSHAHDDEPKYLDNENLVDISFGCYDCEKPLGMIEVGSKCEAQPPYAN